MQARTTGNLEPSRSPTVSHKSVEIEGAPVFSGRILEHSDPAFAALTTVDDYRMFARKLRGSYSILVRDGDSTIAITDHAGCFPVYYLSLPGGGYRITFELASLRPFISGRISAEAIYFFASKRGIGEVPMYAGVETVGRGMVARFQRGRLDVSPWLDWESLLDERPWTLAQARERFLEIASDYLSPFVKSGEGIGCLFSSGTDSAVCAYVLKGLDPDVACFSADYRLRGYSECELASVHARKLGVKQRRILVTLRHHRRAFLAMNTPQSNLPAHHSQLTSLFRLCEKARDDGLRYLVTAEFAGGLFMEFAGFFDAYATTDEYLRHAATLNPAEQLESLVGFQRFDRFSEELLQTMNCSPNRCLRWIDARWASERALFAPWIPKYPFPMLLQLSTQIWTGVRFQNGWLPAQRATGVRFIDPFLDIEMIRFALSLPFRFKWNDGKLKFLLRDILEKGAGIQAPKRASPNPSRVWSLLSGYGDGRRVDQRLKNMLGRLTLGNVKSVGSLYGPLLATTAFGIWIRAHNLSEVEEVSDGAGPAN